MNDQTASDVKKEAADLAAKLQPRSGKFRKISPEMDPLRLGSGWTVPDLDKPQVTRTPAPPASLSSSRRFARASPRPAATAPVTSAPICATVRPRATTASTTRCPAAT